MNFNTFPGDCGTAVISFTSSNGHKVPSHEFAESSSKGSSNADATADTRAQSGPSIDTANAEESSQTNAPSTVDSTWWWPTNAPTKIDWTCEPNNMYRRSAGIGLLDRRVKPKSSVAVIVAITTIDGLKKRKADDQWWQEIISSEHNSAALESILQRQKTSPEEFKNPSVDWTQNYLLGVFQTAYEAALLSRMYQVMQQANVNLLYELQWGGYTERAGVVNVHIVHPSSLLIQKSIMHLTLAKQAWTAKRTLHQFLDIYKTQLNGLTMYVWLERVGREWGVCVVLK